MKSAQERASAIPFSSPAIWRTCNWKLATVQNVNHSFEYAVVLRESLERVKHGYCDRIVGEHDHSAASRKVRLSIVYT